MRPGLFRDALLVVAPCAAVLAGLASIDHHQRLVEAGYRVGSLEKGREDLAREVEHRRAVVAGLSSPVRLLAENRERKLGLDYPVAWNRVEGDAEAARLLAERAKPKAARAAPGKAPAKGVAAKAAPVAKAKTKGKAR